MPLELILPCADYEPSYRRYITELGDEERYPFPLDWAHDDFAALLQRLDEFRNGVNIPDGFVPSTTYWLVDGDELLGVSNLRHYLNDRIRHVGGHIGLGIRPSQRGQGLGKQLLQLTIGEAHQRGLGELHIHCHKHNLPSARMIMANGGVLESEVVLESSEAVQRYLVRCG